MHTLPPVSIFKSALVVFLVVACIPSQSQTPTPPLKSHDAGYYAFRNAATDPPRDPATPVFKLSHSYPTSIPDKCTDCAWLDVKVNFTPSFTDPK